MNIDPEYFDEMRLLNDPILALLLGSLVGVLYWREQGVGDSGTLN